LKTHKIYLICPRMKSKIKFKWKVEVAKGQHLTWEDQEEDTLLSLLIGRKLMHHLVVVEGVMKWLEAVAKGEALITTKRWKFLQAELFALV
jgi:hypothetical protein